MTTSDLEQAAWIRGFGTALAEMHRSLIGGGDSATVRRAARAAMLSLRDFERAQLSNFDLRELAKAGL